MAGPGMPTTPIWQGTPGQGTPGQGGAPGPGRPGQAPPLADPQAAWMPRAEQPAWSPQAELPRGADARGFLGALFDFSFTSFVTTRIIKVLYILIMVIVVLIALAYTIGAFHASATRGFLVLIIGDPLFIIIVMAFWRLILESFVVRFRIAEDVRAMRERGGR
jgi:hypothetical protein